MRRTPTLEVDLTVITFYVAFHLLRMLLSHSYAFLSFVPRTWLNHSHAALAWSICHGAEAFGTAEAFGSKHTSERESRLTLCRPSAGSRTPTEHLGLNGARRQSIFEPDIEHPPRPQRRPPTKHIRATHRALTQASTALATEACSDLN